MNRRAFLSILAGGLAAAADPERLLWTPKRYVQGLTLPPRYTFASAIGSGKSRAMLSQLKVGDKVMIGGIAGPPVDYLVVGEYSDKTGIVGVKLKPPVEYQVTIGRRNVWMFGGEDLRRRFQVE